MSTVRTGYSYYEFLGDGATNTFSINFTLGNLRDSFVTCQVNNEVDAEGNPVYRELTFLPGDTGQVQVQGAVPGIGERIVFRRIVPKELLLHLYSNGSILDYPSLDDTHLQLMMAVHEMVDGFGFANVYTDIDMHGFKITGVNYDSSDMKSVVTFEALQQVAADTAALTMLGLPNGASLVGYGSENVETVLGTLSADCTSAKDRLDDIADSAGSSFVGFVASGTGSIARTAQDKFRDTVSVRDFGAIGNGIADDTAAIQACIDSMTNAGTVFFPNGDYKITSSLNVTRSGTRLVGEGADVGRASWACWPTRIIWAGTGPDRMIEVDTAGTGVVRGISIEGVTLDAALTAGVCPLYSHATTSQGTVRDVCFRNFDTPITLEQSCVCWLFEDVELFESQSTAIELIGDNHNTTFSRVRASNTGLDAAAWSVIRVGTAGNCSNINFNDCDFEAQDYTYQVELLNCRAVKVSGGYAEPQGGTAVFRLGVTGAGVCEGFAMHGFYVQGGSAVQHVLDIKNAAAVHVGAGCHFRWVLGAAVDSNTFCPNSSFDRAVHLYSVGGTDLAIKFGSNADGWVWWDSGTSTPTVVGTGGTANTYTTQKCKWFVSDGFCDFQLSITLSAMNQTGALSINTGIPYTSSAGYNYPVSISPYEGFNLASGAALSARVLTGTSNITLTEQVGTGSYTTVLSTEVTGTMSVQISGRYKVD